MYQETALGFDFYKKSIEVLFPAVIIIKVS